EHYRQALNIKPDYADAHYNLGGALAQQGKLADAVHHYQRALQITPGDADAHTNWGGALAQQGKLAEAAEHYQQALRIKPDHAAAHNNWGAALTRQGNLAEAIEHYRQAVNIKTDYADAHYNLGGALAQQGELADAIHHYQRALQITPDDADAHIHWGLALAQQGRLAEAIEHYRQALRINPGHANAQSNLLNAIRGLDGQYFCRLRDHETEAVREAPIEGARLRTDAKPGAPDPASRKQLSYHPLCGIDRDREAQALRHGDHRGVDAHDASQGIHERASRVARVQRDVGLDHGVDQPARPASEGAPEGAHHPRRNGGLKAVGVPDGHHELADTQCRRLPERGDRQARVIDADERQIG